MHFGFEFGTDVRADHDRSIVADALEAAVLRQCLANISGVHAQPHLRPKFPIREIAYVRLHCLSPLSAAYSGAEMLNKQTRRTTLQPSPT